MADDFEEPRARGEAYIEANISGLAKRDVGRERSTTSLAEIAKNKAQQEYDQRARLMTYILWMVGIAFGPVILIVAVLLFTEFEVESTIGVAFISAIAVQSFAIIGFVARGLYPSSVTKGSRESEPVE